MVVHTTPGATGTRQSLAVVPSLWRTLLASVNKILAMVYSDAGSVGHNDVNLELRTEDDFLETDTIL